VNIEFLLLTTAGAVGFTLIYFGFELRRAGLLHWRSSGFWALASFALYFVASPAACALTVELKIYETSLIFIRGTGRGFWILLVAVLGICAFFITYLHTSYKSVYWKLVSRNQVFNPTTTLILVVFILIGTWSLLVFRAGITEYSAGKLVQGSRFVGSVTGYEASAFLFLIFPLFVLLLSKDKFIRGIGWIISFIFLILTARHGYSRYVAVSFLLGISLLDSVRLQRNWPKVKYVLIILIVAAVLQARGHHFWNLTDTQEISISTKSLKYNPLGILTGPDTSMLATWYISSQLVDNYRGYDYGINTLNYALTGWIPYRYFPGKYFMIDWFEKLRGSNDIDSYISILSGSKPSLLGSFYEHGGPVAVILCMALSGFLCRRLDGMLSSNSPDLIRALGVAIMCHLWMIWGSHDYWAINSVGSVTIPAVFVWLVSRKTRRRRWRIVAVNSEQNNAEVQTATTLPQTVTVAHNPLRV
jgi:hypothetical protein